jgi:hypothetical protein
MKGRRAAIGGVASEKLLQPRIGKIGAERRPHRGQRLERKLVAQVEQADPLHKRQRPGSLRIDVARFQGGKHRGAVGRKPAIPLGILPVREIRDGAGAVLDVGKQVEPGAVAPAMPGEKSGLLEPDPGTQVRTGQCEELFKYPAHGQHRRPGIHRPSAGAELSHLAARRVAAFDHRDVEARCRRRDRACKPAGARAHHDHSVRLPHRFLSLPKSATRALTNQSTVSG